MSFSSDIVYQCNGKQGGFLASSGHRKMLHFKILQGLRPLGHGLSMPWTNWGEGLPLSLPFASQNTIDEGHNAKSLQANLQPEKFVLANQ